jgi:pimeloyl-ACP methyl ester carboxylesterase
MVDVACSADGAGALQAHLWRARAGSSAQRRSTAPARLRLDAAPRLRLGEIAGTSSVTTVEHVEARLGDGLADCWLHSWESLYGSFLHCIVARRAWPDLERLRAARIPILFLHGDRDALAPIARVREASECGGWTLHEYPDAVHALNLTHATAVGRDVGHFLIEQAAMSPVSDADPVVRRHVG